MVGDESRQGGDHPLGSPVQGGRTRHHDGQDDQQRQHDQGPPVGGPRRRVHRSGTVAALPVSPM